MYLIETFNKKEDDKLIDIENGGIYEAMMECDLAIHNIFESLYEIDNNEIQGIITESIGEKLKSFGAKIMRGLETIKNFLKKILKSFINLFKKANQDDTEFVKKAEAKMSGRSTNNTATDNNENIKEKAKSNSDSKSDNEFKGNEKNLTDNNENIKEKAKSNSDSKSDNEFKGNEKNLTTIKGQTTTTHYKIANIKGYTFSGLKFYVHYLDLVTIYKLSYDIIGTTPMDFIEKNFDDPVSAIKEARKKLRPYIAKRYSKDGDGTNFEKEMTNYIYGSKGLTDVSIKFEDAINSLKTECPVMIKKLNDQLGKVDSIFDRFIKGYRQSDIKRMGRYEKIADEKEINEMKKDNEYIKDMMQKISLDYLNCINDTKAMYVASLNICIKAVNVKRKQDRFAINKILGGV